MNSVERIEKTLRREAVDRVAKVEWIIDEKVIDKKVIDKIMPRATEDEFVVKMDYDAVCGFELQIGKSRGEHLP